MDIGDVSGILICWPARSALIGSSLVTKSDHPVWRVRDQLNRVNRNGRDGSNQGLPVGRNTV